MSKAISRIYTGLVLVFLYAPIAIMILFSFNEGKSLSVFSGFSFDWYRQLFGRAEVMTALKNTLLLALLSSAIATVIGTAAAVSLPANVLNVILLAVMAIAIVTMAKK